MDEAANKHKDELEEQQKIYNEELEPLMDKFDAISKEGTEKLKEFNYPELRENKKKLAEIIKFYSQILTGAPWRKLFMVQRNWK